MFRFEKKYYQEQKNTFFEIHDPKQQKEIDLYMKEHHNLPPDGIARETGYSSYVVRTNSRVPLDPKINPSMLKKSRRGKEILIERLSDAPTLPVSCLASVEHVLSMQNEVADFVSESLPSTKDKVMYQILVKCYGVPVNFIHDQARLRDAILDVDDLLDSKNLMTSYNRQKKSFIVEVSTQDGDIQKIIKGIKKLKNMRIMNCDLSEIGLNEGLCLIKGDASNPIHALANIADTPVQKGLLERDAGLTSGQRTSQYQDNRWTFNFYQSLEELQRRAGYSDKSYAVKLYLKP